MKELAEGFRNWLERRERGGRTVKAYQDKAERFLGWVERRGLELNAVNTETVDQYMQVLLVQYGHKPQTRLAFYYAIKQFFDYAVSRTVVSVNPVTGATRPKRERRLKGCLTNDEITRMIYAPGLATEIGRRDTAILTLLTSLGTRATALCGMKTGDIRVEQITVPPRCGHCGQVDFSGGSRLRGKKRQVAIVRVREKGGKEWDIPIHDKAAFYLNKYLVLREKGKDSDTVFITYRQHEIRALNRHGLYAVIRKYARKAGIPGAVTPHSFRRAAITWLLDCGVDPTVVKNFFGHAYLETTEIYRNVTHRSFNWAGIAAERNLLEAIETPMDGVMDGLRRD